MSEGDASPVVYLEVHNGRTGRTLLYQIPEGGPEWKHLALILNGLQPIARAAPPRSVVMEGVDNSQAPT